MSTALRLATGILAERYDALLRLSETLATSSEPEELSRVLVDQLSGVVAFDHLVVHVSNEPSDDLEGRAAVEGPVPAPDARTEEPPSPSAEKPHEVLHIADWSRDERIPQRVKQWVRAGGAPSGSVVVVPLTAFDRRLGTLSIGSRAGITYSTEDIDFLRLVGRVIALAIDGDLTRKRAHGAKAKLDRQSQRLKLVEELTNRITSQLELRELLRSVAVNVREALRCDVVATLLPDPASAGFRVYALDFPCGKGLIKEELLISPGTGDPIERALATLEPVVVDRVDANVVRRESYEYAVAEGLKSHCFIPIASRGRALGLLAIGRTTEGSFAPEDVEFLSRASGQVAVAIENALAARELSELRGRLAEQPLGLAEEVRGEAGFDHIVGSSPAIRRVLALVETVAPSDATVLLLGETGTGKELVARAIHDRSRRARRPFVTFNCAAVPSGLLESELFGHERGAFTGATSHRLGRLELADSGTLFLDEVGDLPLEIQPKLLRALQQREFERLGSACTKRADVRLVAATNRDLEAMVSAREFRADLFYRLNVFPIRIPPLRERRDDIAPLVRHFVQRFARQLHKPVEAISASAMAALVAWDWPGNVRELENVVERAVILTRGPTLDVQAEWLREGRFDTAVGQVGPRGRDEIVRIVKETIGEMHSREWKTAAKDYDQKHREEILRVLGESRGRVGGADGAAARLGVKRTTLLARLRRLGIDPKQFS